MKLLPTGQARNQRRPSHSIKQATKSQFGLFLDKLMEGRGYKAMLVGWLDTKSDVHVYCPRLPTTHFRPFSVGISWASRSLTTFFVHLQGFIRTQ